MKEIYICYTADAWLTRTSEERIAIATTKRKAVNLIKKYIARKRFEKLSADDLENLDRLWQTQCRGENYIIERITKEQFNCLD